MAAPNKFARARALCKQAQRGVNHLFGVMAGLVPAIHVYSLSCRKKDVDAREDGVPAASRGGVSLRGHE